MPPFCFPYLENNTTSANYGCQYSLMCIGDWIIWNKLNEWKHRCTLFLLRLPWTVNNDFRTHVVNRRMTQGSKNPPGCDVNLYQKNITLTRAFKKAERHHLLTRRRPGSARSNANHCLVRIKINTSSEEHGCHDCKPFFFFYNRLQGIQMLRGRF